MMKNVEMKCKTIEKRLSKLLLVKLTTTYYHTLSRGRVRTPEKNSVFGALLKTATFSSEGLPLCLINPALTLQVVIFRKGQR